MRRGGRRRHVNGERPAAFLVPCGASGTGIGFSTEVIAMLKSLTSIGALALLLAACAATTPAPEKTTAAATPPPGCVAQTATRLPVKDGACAGFGNSYSKQDLDNTGQVFADRALGMLDPSVRVGH